MESDPNKHTVTYRLISTYKYVNGDEVRVPSTLRKTVQNGVEQQVSASQQKWVKLLRNPDPILLSEANH